MRNVPAEDNVMAKDAIEYLVEIGRRIEKAEAEPIIKEIQGETYVFVGGQYERFDEMDPKPAPDSFRAYTLDGLITWIQEDVNHFFDNDEKCVVSVVSPARIEVTTPSKGVNNKRQLLAVCEYESPRIEFDRYMDSEDFCIMVQTCFVEDENRDIVLQVARNLVEEQSEQTADDGISQRVVTKSGIQSIDTVTFRNPAILAPLRTFTEVRQPYSPFVVRFKEGKQAAIFQADGGKWKVEAVQNIGRYLAEALVNENVVVIA